MTEDSLTHASATERRDRLVQLVRDEGYCTVLDLAQHFAVSEMTIRRDVARLADEGRLRAFHGGVGSLSSNDSLGSEYGSRERAMKRQKRAIAEHALRFVAPATAIGIDAGTTAAGLASLIAATQRVKVVTQSLPVISAVAFAPGVDLECLGGEFHQDSLSFAGPSTLAAISNVHIDTLFLGASGLNDRGVFCANGFDAITKRALIDVSDRVILIADSSKFSTTAMVRICDWNSIDRLIMDDGLAQASRTMLADRGVMVDEIVDSFDRVN